jgi:hypothetical protein
VREQLGELFSPRAQRRGIAFAQEAFSRRDDVRCTETSDFLSSPLTPPLTTSAYEVLDVACEAERVSAFRRGAKSRCWEALATALGKSQPRPPQSPQSFTAAPDL